MDSKIILGENVKRLRLYRGLEQTELAKRAKLSSAVISRLERGVENITADNLIKIADVLEADLEELFCRAGKCIAFKFIISRENLDALKTAIEAIKELAQKKEG